MTSRIVLPLRPSLLAAAPFATSPWVRRIVPLAFVLSTFAAAPAWAHGGASGGPPLEVPPPPAGDGLKAFEIVKEVEASTTEPRAKKIVAEALEQAKKALERAHGARASSDAVHARMLDGLALEWAETARELLRASTAEQTARASADKAREASVRAERARALLEETQARRGRAEAELERALAEEKEAREKAAAAEEARLAAGKPGPKQGKPASGKDKPAAPKTTAKPAGGAKKK